MEPVTAAESARILSYLNQSRSSSLALYLEHFGRVADPVDPVITEFSSPRMVIQYGKKGNRRSWEYAFQPPMQAGQARVRLEQMHTQARVGLGRSEITMNDFHLAAGAWFGVAFCAVLELLVLITPPLRLVKAVPWAGSLVQYIFRSLGIIPKSLYFGLGIKALLAGPILVAHAIEVATVLPGLLKKYNTTKKTVRLQYQLATFIGGFPVWRSFRVEAEGKERELEGKTTKSE